MLSTRLYWSSLRSVCNSSLNQSIDLYDYVWDGYKRTRNVRSQSRSMEAINISAMDLNICRLFNLINLYTLKLGVLKIIGHVFLLKDEGDLKKMMTEQYFKLNNESAVTAQHFRPTLLGTILSLYYSTGSGALTLVNIFCLLGLLRPNDHTRLMLRIDAADFYITSREMRYRIQCLRKNIAV